MWGSVQNKHTGRKMKRGGVSVGIQQAAGCCLQGTSVQTADHHLQAHIRLFTRATSAETPRRAVAAAAGSLSTFVSICCCSGACSSTEHMVCLLFGLQDANRPLKQVGGAAAAAAAGGSGSTGCESWLVSLFVVAVVVVC